MSIRRRIAALTRAAVPAIALTLLAALRAAHAQGFALVPAGPNTLTGIVTDSAGRPIANAEVFVEALKQRTRTREDGQFRFDHAKPAEYAVVARSIGFVSESRMVTVGEKGGAVRFTLLPTPGLPTVVTTAKPGGLSGVIGDTSYRAVPGVAVWVLGTGHATTTDSTGTFFLPVKPGHYLVKLKRDGFAQQLVSVTIPKDEGRKIAAWMLPASGKTDPRAAAMLFDLPGRLRWASSARSKFFTREDINKAGSARLEDLITRGGVGRVYPECMAFLNGDPLKMAPLWALSPHDIEFIEVYGAKLTMDRPEPVTGIRSRQSFQDQAAAGAAGDEPGRERGEQGVRGRDGVRVA